MTHGPGVSWDDFKAGIYCYIHDVEREKWLPQAGIKEQAEFQLALCGVGGWCLGRKQEQPQQVHRTHEHRREQITVSVE